MVGETLYGLGVGWITATMWRRITDARVEVAISLLTPFLAYLVPQALGGSGVLATVAAGMYIGIQAPELVSAETRLTLASAWDVLTFLLEGSLFLLTGLQFRSAMSDGTNVHGYQPLLYGAAVTASVIVLRFVWTWLVSWMGATFFGRKEPRPPKAHLVYLGWCGMRGGISLAAAIPSRNLIIVVTACVIAGTLLLQGGPLPALVRHLKLDQEARKEQTESTASERQARMDAIQAALDAIESCGEQAARVRDEYSHRLDLLKKGSSEEADLSPAGYRQQAVQIRLAAIDAERDKLVSLHREGRLSEHILHRIERDVDLREVRLRSMLRES